MVVKTRDERYQYVSKLFSGAGNPMYGNHTLNPGRVYTKERNKKVSNAVKEWAKTHREHYYRIGVLGGFESKKPWIIWQTNRPRDKNGKST
jgi:hypothetical protein